MHDSEAPSGTFPSQTIRQLVSDGHVLDSASDALARVQPSSLDLTLSEECWQLPGSVLPLRSERVREIVANLGRRKLDLSAPTLLDRGKVYLIRLSQRFDLPAGVHAYTNNKSSIGRIDLGTRSVCDNTPRYDKIPAGYRGEVWVEVIPRSFDVILQAGQALNQAIFHTERRILRTNEIRNLHESAPGPLLYDKNGFQIPAAEMLVEDGVMLTLDLDQPVIGFQSRKTFEPIDLAKIANHDPAEFFEPIPHTPKGHLWLERGRFYVFSTWEYIRVPPAFAVEMLPYDTSAGDFRAHYAGFFDPGFGYGLQGEERGTPAVLEVRSYEDDLIIRHRQPICRMAYEELSAVPDRLYHASIGSTYANQRGPKLSKYFRRADQD